MKKKISMEDIAKKLGVSKNTVSLALRGIPGISPATRQLIFDTAKAMGYSYKRDVSNESNIKKLSKNICLILSKSTKNSIGFFNYVQFGVEAEARKQGLNIIIYYYDELQEQFETPLCIKDGIISGIITLGRVSSKTINSIISFNLPLVMIDHYFDDIKLNYILSDNISGGYRATEYLIKSGSRKISFSGDINASISFYDRYQGYLRALSAYNLTPHLLLSKSIETLASHDINLAVQYLESIPDFPEAIFCCNDAEAIAAMRTLNMMNLKVPQDISILGFDDIEFSQSTSPELTTMRVEKQWLGKKAVLRLIEIRKDPLLTPEKLLVETTLIERNSVKISH